MSSLALIRPATTADYQAICGLVTTAEELSLVHPGGHYPWTVAQLERVAATRLDLSVMEAEGELIGFANLYHMEPQRFAFIGNVIIKASQRGRGHGRRLIEYMLQRIFQLHKLAEARISVFADNTPAIKLYTSLGFRTYAEEMREVLNTKRRLLHMRLATNE
jgi:ribosomal protein S18 acetylase RimI-like enzyme